MFRTAPSRVLICRPNIQASYRLTGTIYPRILTKTIESQSSFSKSSKGAQQVILQHVLKRRFSASHDSQRPLSFLDDRQELKRELQRKIEHDLECDNKDNEFWLTKSQKRWRYPESEATPPKVIRPIIFFVGVGTLSILSAALWTVKKTGDWIETAVQYEGFIPFLQENIITIPKGNKEAFWGRFNEQDLRVLMQAKTYWQHFITGVKFEMWIKNAPIIHFYGNHLIYIASYPSKFYLSLSDEQKATLPILAITTAIYLTIRAGRHGVFDSKAFRVIRSHLIHIPAANRLHTLATSTFTHSSSLSFMLNASVIFAFGASTLTNSIFLSDRQGNENHTAEITSLYHFFAYCICAGTFSSTFTQVFSRLMLHRVKKICGTTLATRYIGRVPHFGMAGISSSLMAMQLEKYIEANIKKQIPEDQQIHEDTIAYLCIFLSCFPVLAPIVNLSGKDINLRGIHYTVRTGGILFGLFYAKYGNSLWEKSKQIFYERDSRIQNAIAGKPIRQNHSPLVINYQPKPQPEKSARVHSEVHKKEQVRLA